MVPRSAIGEGASAAPTTDAKRPAVTWFHGKESGQRAKLATHGKRRRLREASAKGDAAPPSLDDIYAAAGGRVCCAVCRLPVPREHASLEHVVALASGGAHDAVNAAIRAAQANGIELPSVLRFSRHRSLTTLQVYVDAIANRQGEIAALVAGSIGKK